ALAQRNRDHGKPGRHGAVHGALPRKPVVEVRAETLPVRSAAADSHHPSLPGGRSADEFPSGRNFDVERRRIQDLLLAGAVASGLDALGAAYRAYLRRLQRARSQVRNRRRAALELLLMESVPAAAADGV